MQPEVTALTAAEARAQTTALADILVACVHAGASVGFMAPLPHSKAESFFRSVAESVAAGDRILIVATDSGRPLGTVQVILKQPDNQPHRADISKVLVHPDARRRGLGARLMTFAEQAARAAGKSLVVLDTETGGDAERLYTRLGWTPVGQIPHYALMPDGSPCSTTIFYKNL